MSRISVSGGRDTENPRLPWTAVETAADLLGNTRKSFQFLIQIPISQQAPAG